MTHRLVWRMQAALVAQGYPLPRWGVDGHWGAETAAALAAWRTDHPEAVGVEGADLVALVEAGTLPAARIALAEWLAWPGLGKAGQAAARAKYIREGAGDAPVTGYQWCGAFAAWCYPSVHRAIRFALMQSTVRLWLLGSYGTDRNLWPSDGVVLPDGTHTTARNLHASTGLLRRWWHGADCVTAEILPGDILCVRNSKTKDPREGGHVLVAVERSAPGEPVSTISGNGAGKRADGTTGGGVVRNSYERDQVRQILRLSPHDFDSTLRYLA